jgi:hypothetical protein
MVLVAERESGAIALPDTEGFAALDMQHAEFAPTPEQRRLLGSHALSGAILLDAPANVTQVGDRLTNPCQVEEIELLLGREAVRLQFAYFRREPAKEHLGKTRAEPYLILRDRNGTPYLSELLEAMVIVGEDPRLTLGVRIEGHLGKIHEGPFLSTVEAEAMPDDPQKVKGLRQKYYWGKSLDRMEQIGEGPGGEKNRTISTAYADWRDTTIDELRRPFPHIGYRRLPNLNSITDDSGPEPIIITEGFLPPGFHCGPNNSWLIDPGHHGINIHEAYKEPTPNDKWALHYRLGDYIFELPSNAQPRGLLIAHGVVARRSDFPAAAPKPPEGEVDDYTDILYGSRGRGKYKIMVAGGSDNVVALAHIKRYAP